MGATSVITVCLMATIYKQIPKMPKKIDDANDFSWSSHYPFLK